MQCRCLDSQRPRTECLTLLFVYFIFLFSKTHGILAATQSSITAAVTDTDADSDSDSGDWRLASARILRTLCPTLPCPALPCPPTTHCNHCSNKSYCAYVQSSTKLPRYLSYVRMLRIANGDYSQLPSTRATNVSYPSPLRAYLSPSPRVLMYLLLPASTILFPFPFPCLSRLFPLSGHLSGYYTTYPLSLASLRRYDAVPKTWYLSPFLSLQSVKLSSSSSSGLPSPCQPILSHGECLPCSPCT